MDPGFTEILAYGIWEPVFQSLCKVYRTIGTNEGPFLRLGRDPARDACEEDAALASSPPVWLTCLPSPQPAIGAHSDRRVLFSLPDMGALGN